MPRILFVLFFLVHFLTSICNIRPFISLLGKSDIVASFCPVSMVWSRILKSCQEASALTAISSCGTVPCKEEGRQLLLLCLVEKVKIAMDSTNGYKALVTSCRLTCKQIHELVLQ